MQHQNYILVYFRVSCVAFVIVHKLDGNRRGQSKLVHLQIQSDK